MKSRSVYVSTLPSPAVLLGAFGHNLFSSKKRKVLNLKPSRAYLRQTAHYETEELEVVVSNAYPITAFKQAYTKAVGGGLPGKGVITVA